VNLGGDIAKRARFTS